MGLNRSTLARLAWGAVALNVLVILWGAVVRATGSGAGCGSHWPLCNGQVLPESPRLATMIEFGHRVTSGLALLAVVAVAALVLRSLRGAGRDARSEPCARSLRRLAWLSILFIAGEAAIGAGIVLLRYVESDASLARAGWMGGHLVNTFLLLGTLALLADRLGRDAAPAGPAGARSPAPFDRGELAGFAALVAAGATGAVAALGDTLFPVQSIREGMAQELAAGAHPLLRLRTLHPLIAIGAGLLWLYFAQEARRRRPGPASAAGRAPILRAANAVTLTVFAQLAVGLVNLGLLAPIPLQLLHLLLADLLWIAAAVLVDRRRWA